MNGEPSGVRIQRVVEVAHNRVRSILLAPPTRHRSGPREVAMRKRYWSKRRACALCKPRKRGWAPRWDDRELIRLRDWERERERTGTI